MGDEKAATGVVHWHTHDRALEFTDVKVVRAPQATQEIVPTDEELASMIADMSTEDETGPTNMNMLGDPRVDSKTPVSNTSQKTGCLWSCWECLTCCCCSSTNNSTLNGIDDLNFLARIDAGIYLNKSWCYTEAWAFVEFEKVSINNQQKKIVCCDSDSRETIAALSYTVNTSEIEISSLFLSSKLKKKVGLEYLLLYAALMDVWLSNQSSKKVIYVPSFVNADNAIIPALKKAGFTQTTDKLTIDLKTFVEKHAHKVRRKGIHLFTSLTNDQSACCCCENEDGVCYCCYPCDS